MDKSIPRDVAASLRVLCDWMLSVFKNGSSGDKAAASLIVVVNDGGGFFCFENFGRTGVWNNLFSHQFIYIFPNDIIAFEGVDGYSVHLYPPLFSLPDCLNYRQRSAKSFTQPT